MPRIGQLFDRVQTFLTYTAGAEMDEVKFYNIVGPPMPEETYIRRE